MARPFYLFLLVGVMPFFSGERHSLSAEPFQYRLALPGFQFALPRDHGAHPDYRTEWWYFTGHLFSPEGRRYGYELTFFRFGLQDRIREENPSRWAVKDVYFGHFALTDVAGGKFRFFERRGRTGVGLAGIRETPLRIWIRDWALSRKGDSFHLHASENGSEIDLTLDSDKPPAVHGIDGVSQKSEGRGQASHYYSLTRLKTEGTLTDNGKSVAVTGQSWMDHEFGSNQLGKDQVGWDWFSIQLDDGRELMLYRMRQRDGQPDRNSSGTLVALDGTTRHLSAGDFAISAREEWTSPRTGGIYPAGWRIEVPSSGLDLQVAPVLQDQELVTGETTRVTYWEGSVDIKGTSQGRKIKGLGYVELTGYAGSLGGKF